MEDFQRFYYKDVAIEVVNLNCATMKDALNFKEFVKHDIDLKFRKIIIDLSTCEFIDSTFIGSIVVLMKEMLQRGGELRIVEPVAMARFLISKTQVLKTFNSYPTRKAAIMSFFS
ncbi:MAG: STAS domain-containing protein [Ignavibacteriaceae bacterium]|nr:STAS domain-containing protein [Ignavibacteriaceae bacterium]